MSFPLTSARSEIRIMHFPRMQKSRLSRDPDLFEHTTILNMLIFFFKRWFGSTKVLVQFVPTTLKVRLALFLTARRFQKHILQIIRIFAEDLLTTTGNQQLLGISAAFSKKEKLKRWVQTAGAVSQIIQSTVLFRFLQLEYSRATDSHHLVGLDSGDMLMFGGIFRETIKENKEDTYLSDVWRLSDNKWSLDGFLNKVKIRKSQK